MSRISGRNSKPEMLIRRGLHSLGLRYRLHDRALPGRPDLVFPRYRAVVFVHGCFWHAHRCMLSKLPTTRVEFWRRKLTDNARRDEAAITALWASGWRVLVIWECALRGPGRAKMDSVLGRASRYIREGKARLLQIGGSDSGRQDDN